MIIFWYLIILWKKLIRPNARKSATPAMMTDILNPTGQLTIAPYLKEPYFFPSSDTEIWEVAYSCLTSDILEFQIVCDISTEKAQSKMNLVLEQTQYAMEQIPLYGQISVNAQYGIADYVIVTVTVSPE